ncbi:MAG: gluconokinase [Cyclobacteriaceae bacterium]
MIYIVCGVSGTGKTTIGKTLASQLDVPFYDADDFHSENNIKKMQSGTPLDDSDRINWLKTLSSKILQWERDGGAVLACSALKELYRQLLVPVAETPVRWIVLEGDKEVILERMKARKGHFFDAKMLDSQFEIYERPSYGLILNVSESPDELIGKIFKEINT